VSVPPPNNYDQRQRIKRLQNWLVTLAVVVVFLGVAVPTVVIIYFNEQAQETQTAIVCDNAKTTILILKAGLRNGDITEDIAQSLGLPIPPPPPIVIPELPEECRE
jgi:hypothetical protein